MGMYVVWILRLWLHSVRATANLCVICGEPSKRSDRVGSDMVTCDSAFCGLFHKSCNQYDESIYRDGKMLAEFCLNQSALLNQIQSFS